MTPRHWRVLEQLSDDPLLATGHIEALLFTEGTRLSRARTCRRILRELTGWKLLYRERPVPGGSGGGSGSAVFALTAAGDRLLALRDGRAPGRYRRPQDRGDATTRHLLAVADQHVALVQVAQSRGAAVRWQSEPGCWLRFRSSEGPELLKPDAYAEVDLPGESRLAWLEVDRGTQSVPTTIQAKIRRYCRAATALAAERKAVPAVYFVVERTARRDRIAAQFERWAAREGVGEATARRLLQVSSPTDFAVAMVA